MQSPRTTRKAVPTPAALGFERPAAESELEELGWYKAEHSDLLRDMSGAADPDQVLLGLLRFKDAVSADEWSVFNQSLHINPELRLRIFGLLGASTVLADHLVAHPEQWQEVGKPAPTPGEMMRFMLEAVDARPDCSHEGCGATDSLDTPGMYRSPLRGTDAVRTIKHAYRTLLMRIAAVDLAGTFLVRSTSGAVAIPVPYTHVTAMLSTLADAALTATLACAQGTVWGDEQADARLSVIALGKCGARELNYISDVDVIFVAEPASPKVTRVASEFIRIGSQALFDVDAGLRPEGKNGALVRTLESHKAYYSRWAETWEFQALLKSRPQTGDMALGQDYIDALHPLVWEASRRDSFVPDVQAMRSRVIRNVPENLKSRELKLGRGGLRDVEFAVQLLQMVHGRVDESLRVSSTVAALNALIAGGYVGREDGHALIKNYEFMRLLEHRLQLQRLRRTHTMPKEKDVESLRRIARAAGIAGTGGHSSAAQLLELYRKTQHSIADIHTKLFYRPLLNSVVNLDTGTLALSPEAARLQLGALNYNFPDRAYQHLQVLASGSSRKQKLQQLLLPSLMTWLGSTSDPDAGLLNYRKLSETMEDRSWFLRLLRDEGAVGKRLMHILGTSPYVSELLLSSPDTVKLLGDGANNPKLISTNPEKVRTALVAAAGRQSSPEQSIAVARSLRRAELARIGAADLLGMMDVRDVCRSLSIVWDAVLHAALAAEIRAAGEPKARIAVIGMGRLGGAELGYGSDADVLFVCDPLPGVGDTEAVTWSIGVCDRMRRRLAKPSGDPPLDVDLGLRPEGRSGPVVRTLASYATYYEKWAETWEMQSLLRATYIAGDEEVGEAFIALIDPLRYPEGGIDESAIREVRRMKARVDKERLPKGADKTTHTKLGRGALTDIEWTVQLLTMMHAHEYPALHTASALEGLDAIEEAGILDATSVERLRHAWLTATGARSALVLVRGKRTDQLPPPGPALAHVAGAAGWDPDDSRGYLEHYLKATRRARRVVDNVFWGESESEFSIEP